MLSGNDLSIEMVPMIKEQIAKLQKHQTGKGGPHGDDDEDEGVDNASGDQVSQRLDRLEHLVQEMSDRLKSIEAHLAPQKTAHE
jgi:hypothetical protein